MSNLHQGKNTSIQISEKQEEYLQELEWENLGISKAFKRALKYAVRYHELQEEKRREIREIERKYDL